MAVRRPYFTRRNQFHIVKFHRRLREVKVRMNVALCGNVQCGTASGTAEFKTSNKPRTEKGRRSRCEFRAGV